MKRLFYISFIALLSLLVSCEREVSDDAREGAGGSSYRVLKVQVGNPKESDDEAKTRSVFDISSDGIYDVHLFAFYAESKGGNKQGDVVIYGSTAGDLSGQPASRAFYTPSGSASLREHLPFNWALPDDGTRMTVYTIVNANQSAADADIHSAHSALATALDAMAARTDLTESEFLASELFKAHYSDLDTYFGSMVNADMAEAPLIKTGRTTVSLSQNSTTTIYLRVYRLLSRFSIAMDAGINSAASVAERGYWLTLANAYVKNMNRDVDFFLDDMPDDGIPADVSASSTGSLCLGDYLDEQEISDFSGGAFVDFLVTPNDRGEKPSGVNASHWYDMYDTYMDAGGDAAEFAGKGTYVEFVFEKHADFDGCANVAHARTDGRYLGQELVRLYLNNGKVKLNSGDSYYIPSANNFRLVRNLSRRILLKSLPASSSGELDIHWVDDDNLRVLSYDASRQTSPSSVAGVSARSAEGPCFSRHTIRLYSEVPFDPSETQRVNDENDAAGIGYQVHWGVDNSDNHYAICTFTPTDGSIKSIHFDRKRPYFRHLRPKLVNYDELQFDVPEKVYMGQRPDAVVSGYDEGVDVSQFSWSTTSKTKYSLAFQGANWSMGMVDGKFAYDLTSVTGSGCTINGKRTGVQTLKFSVGQEGDDFYFDGPSFDVQVAAPTLLPLAFAEYQIADEEKKILVKLNGDMSPVKFYYLDDDGNILYNDDDIRFDTAAMIAQGQTPENVKRFCNWSFLMDLDMLDISLACNSPYVDIVHGTTQAHLTDDTGEHWGYYNYEARLKLNSGNGASNTVFQNIINMAAGVSDADPFLITATTNKDIGVQSQTKEVEFINPVLAKPSLITERGFNVVGLGNYSGYEDNSFYGQDLYYEKIAGLINPDYLNSDGTLKSNVKLKLDFDCGRYQGMSNRRTPYGDAFFAGDNDGDVVICWAAYNRDGATNSDEHMPGKIKVGLQVTFNNGSSSYTATVPWFEFYRGVRYWYGLTANTVLTSSSRVDGIVSSVLYDIDKTTQISSISYFYDGDMDSWKDGIHLGTPSISDTYNLKTVFGANTQFNYDYRFGSKIYTFYVESLNPQSWYSSLPDFAPTGGSIYPPSNFYNHMHPDVSIPRNRMDEVQKYFKEETGAFYDVRKGASNNSLGDSVDPYGYWPPLIYVSRLHPYQWVDEAAQAPLSSDKYIVDIYYDSYYEPVKWSDLTTAQKVAAGLAVLTLDPLTIGVVAGIASPWWVNRANIGFGLRISTMDTNDGSDYHIPSINVTYDSGSGLSALAQYVDYIDFYSNKEQTSTFRIYTNALMQYRFPWNSMYQEWTDSGSGGFIHYGTNLQQYDTFYDDAFHDVSFEQPNSRDGIVMNAGIRINPNGAPSGAPKLTVVERGAYQVDSFTEFYGIAKIGFKDQYLKYTLRNSGMSAEYDVNYKHHYEPKFAHRTPGGDYYDDFSY